MTGIVSYELADSVATIALDDGLAKTIDYFRSLGL